MPGPDGRDEPDPHFHLRDLPHDPDLGPEAEEVPGRVGPTGWAEIALLAAVVAGGFLGTLGRYELDLAWPTAPGHFPTTTFVINTTGAFLLGALLTVLVHPPLRHRLWRAFLGTGVLGGWTTYSALAVDGAILVKHGHIATSLGYLAASVAAGVAAVALGMAVGRAAADRGARAAALPSPGITARGEEPA